MAKKVYEYEIVSLGVDHPDYFRGFGTAFTSFDDSFVGMGTDAKEAYEDAVDQAVSSGYEDEFPRRPRGINKRDKVPAEYLQDAESDAYYYVGVRVRGTPKKRKARRLKFAAFREHARREPAKRKRKGTKPGSVAERKAMFAKGYKYMIRVLKGGAQVHDIFLYAKTAQGVASILKDYARYRADVTTLSFALSKTPIWRR